MTKCTRYSGHTLPQGAVYNLSGTLVATSYKRHASGQIELWHFRDRRLLTMPISQFEATYIVKPLNTT